MFSGGFHVAAPCGNDGSLPLKSEWRAKGGMQEDILSFSLCFLVSAELLQEGPSH